MSRSAQVLLAIAIVSATIAGTLAYAGPNSGRADLTPLWIIAGLAVVGVFVVDSDVARSRVPFLRPAYLETMRQLGIVAHEGQRLVGRLNVYRAFETDDVASG